VRTTGHGAALVAVTVLALSACAVSSGDGVRSAEDGVRGPKVVTAANGTILLVAAPTDGGRDALATGRLAVLAGGCLGITAGGEETVVLWPSGTGLASSAHGITINGHVIEVGDLVSMGGGVVPTSDATTTPAPPPECHADGVWVAGPGSVELTNGPGS
jgi:hypothetical protein